MKDEFATDLIQRMRKLPLGTTDRSATEHGRDLSSDEVRDALKIHDEAIGRLIYDAVHRRRDVQEVKDWRVVVDAWREAPVETATHIGAGWIVGGLVIGGLVAVLHLAELLAIAWLWASR